MFPAINWIKCVSEGVAIGTVIEQLIEAYLAGQVTWPPRTGAAD